MKTIDEMVNDVLDNEGGYVNHRADKGGPTNLGITQETLSGYLKRQASIDDVKKLSKETACAIYKKCYYTDTGIHKLPELLQPLMFDMAVNHGGRKAAQLLQRLLVKSGYANVKTDGVIGRMTCEYCMQALTDLGDALVNLLVDQRINFYLAIVNNNPSQKVFLKGWLSRAEKFRI